MTPEPKAALDALLGGSEWIPRLSRALVADPATADDLVQETWVDVLKRPLVGVADVRAWFATILRRKASRHRRATARRLARERTAAREEAIPSHEELADRVAMHRALADAVLALDEPYRATIALRYFENLDVDAIATRTGVPRNTVRSRLQRGLVALRERLDATQGGRERWLPLVLAASHREVIGGAALGGVAGGLAMATTMKALLSVAAALAVGVWISFSYLRSERPEDRAPEHVATPPALETAATSAAESRPGSEIARTEVVGASALPERAASAPHRVVDLAGKPLAGVRMRLAGPHTVRWQGGDLGWISGDSSSFRLMPDEERRLREDPGHAATFFAKFAHPEEWRAAILGTPIADREASSAEDGSFAFVGTRLPADSEIEVADPAFALIRAGKAGRDPWVVGPALRVRGVVRDQRGAAIPDARLRACFVESTGIMTLESQPETRGEPDGSFLVRRALAGGILRVAKDGFATAFVPLGVTKEETKDVVLTELAPAVSTVVDGIVLDGRGLPIAGASVWVGRASTKSSPDGRFAIVGDEPPPEAAFTVVAKGLALHQRNGFGARLRADRNVGRDLVVVLGIPAATLRGVVLGTNGLPLGGALVGLVDPALLDFSFESVEARLGGWSGGVTCAPDGTFTISGLSEREYRVRAIDPATGVVSTSGPVRANQRDVILRLPQNLRRNVRGRVEVEGRAPGPATTVEVAYCTHVTKGGGTAFDAAPAVACDPEGRFVLPVLPPAEAWLVVRNAGRTVDLFPVESFAEGESELVLTCRGQRWLQVVAGVQKEERELAFEREDGTTVPARSGSRQATVGKDGKAPVVPVVEGAVALWVGKPGSGGLRLRLTDDRAIHLPLP